MWVIGLCGLKNSHHRGYFGAKILSQLGLRVAPACKILILMIVASKILIHIELRP